MSRLERQTLQGFRREDAAMRKWFAEVSTAAACFEARWTWSRPARIDSKYCQARSV
jgi:hypothetical protein